MKSDTAAHILSRIKSSDAGEVLSSISEHLRPFLDLLTCREDERARANRSFTKRFLPFIKKSVSLLHKRLSLITSPESSPGDLFRAYDFCLECYEIVSRHPTTVQVRRLGLIHSYQKWGWYTHAYNDGFRVLEQLNQPEPNSRFVLFLPLAKPGFGQGNLARVLLKVVESIVSSVAMSRDMEKNQYLRVCSLLHEIKPWLRYLVGNAREKFFKLILSDMEKCALLIVRESVRFDEGFVHSFCISTLNEYSVSSLPKCHLYKFSRQVLSLLFLSNEIKTSQPVEAVACELKVEAEPNWLDLLALVSYCAHKSLLAGDGVSKQLNDIAAVFLEVSFFLPDMYFCVSYCDMIMDQSAKEDTDGELRDEPAEEENVLTFSKGPMTRARTRKLIEAIGGLIRKSLKQEECLGGSLILQDTLITIQAILPSI